MEQLSLASSVPPQHPAVSGTIGRIGRTVTLGLLVALGAGKKADAQVPPWLPVPQRVTEYFQGQTGEKLPPLKEPVDRVPQRDLTPMEFPEAAPYVTELRKNLRMMDNRRFRVREQGTADACRQAIELSQQINPLPPSAEALLNVGRDEVSLEQYYRMQSVNARVERKTGFQPTRVPVGEEEAAAAVLDKLSRHGGLTIRFAEGTDVSALKELKLESGENSFAEIVQAVCRHTGTVPSLPPGEHFVMELKKAAEGQQVLIDESGLLLGAHTPSRTDGDTVLPPELDVYADPQRALIEIVQAQTGAGQTRVRIHPTISPLWHQLQGFDQPVVGVTAGQAAEVPVGRLHLRMGTLADPETRDVPLGDGSAWTDFSSQQKVHVIPDGGSADVIMQHGTADVASTYWTETRTNTQQYQFLDKDGQPVGTVADGLSATGTDGKPVYTAHVRPAGEGTPATLRIRGYRHEDLWDDRDELPPFIFRLPKEKAGPGG